MESVPSTVELAYPELWLLLQGSPESLRSAPVILDPTARVCCDLGFPELWAGAVRRGRSGAGRGAEQSGVKVAS